MKKEQKALNVNPRLFKGVSTVAGIFAFVICILMIANYFQINRLDPVNTEIINTLVERLSENPNDEALKNEIRELDLLARKAYFTNQWQIRTGGYLLLISVIIMIIASQLISSSAKLSPVVSSGKDENNLVLQKTARKWVSIGGTGLVVIALVFAYLSHNELGKTFTQAAVSQTVAEKTAEESPVTNQQETQPTEQAVAVVEEAEEETATEQAEVVEEAKAEESPTQAYAGEYPTAEMKKNFPAFRGPGGNGIAYQKNIPVSWDGASGQNIKWKTAIPIHGYNSPVVWGNKVFLSGGDANKRQIYCFDANTGKILWKADADNITGSPATAPDVTDDTGHAAATVTTDGKKVFAIFSTGDLLAVDMNGKRVWAKNLGVPQNHYGFSSSLYVFDDKLIIQYDHRKASKVIALNVNSGDQVWSTERKGKISWASPVILKTGAGVEIFLVTDPFVASYDAMTGKELWRKDCLYGEIGPSVAYADGVVFALNEYASLVAIKPGAEPTILWEDYDYLSDVPSPVATDKYLFVVTSYGMMVCYDAKTGAKYWEKEFDNGIYSSPILVEDKIYVIDKEGITHIIKADKEFASLGSPKLGEAVYSTPAFGDGRVYIRANNNLYCIGK